MNSLTLATLLVLVGVANAKAGLNIIPAAINTIGKQWYLKAISARTQCLQIEGFSGLTLSIDDLLSHKVLENESQKCMVKCVMEKIGVHDVDGNIMVEGVKSFLGNMIGTSNLVKGLEIAKNCDSNVPSDANSCDRSSSAFQCFLKGLKDAGIPHI